jgi:Zn-finger nucleic acid-binding protein
MPLLMCPNDNSAMQEINRNGVMIDVCPQCRGVWMDRGELEKLLELVGRPGSAEADSHRPSRRHDERDWDDKPARKHKKRFELFDFFD